MYLQITNLLLFSMKNYLENIYQNQDLLPSANEATSKNQVIPVTMNSFKYNIHLKFLIFCSDAKFGTVLDSLKLLGLNRSCCVFKAPNL